MAELIALPAKTADVLRQPPQLLRPGVFQTTTVHLVPDPVEQRPLRLAVGLAIAESESLTIEGRLIQVSTTEEGTSASYMPQYHGFPPNLANSTRDALEAVFDKKKQYTYWGSQSPTVLPTHRDSSGIQARTVLNGCIKSALSWFEELPRVLAWIVEFNSKQREHLKVPAVAPAKGKAEWVDRALRKLAASPDITAKELAEHCGVATSTVTRHPVLGKSFKRRKGRTYDADRLDMLPDPNAPE